MAAIYQWFPGGGIFLTTTIYPAEATDTMDFSASLVYGLMLPILPDPMDGNVESLSGSITVVLLSSGPHDDPIDGRVISLTGSITAVLLSSGPHDDPMDGRVISLSGSITPKLVEAVLEENAMDIGVSLVSGSMTPV